MNDVLNNFNPAHVFKSILTLGDRSRASLKHGSILAQGLVRGTLVICCVAWNKKQTWVESLAGIVGFQVRIDISVPETLQTFAQRMQDKLQLNGYQHVVVSVVEQAPPAKPRKRKEKSK